MQYILKFLIKKAVCILSRKTFEEISGDSQLIAMILKIHFFVYSSIFTNVVIQLEKKNDI